ncbi:hypothetical protein PMIN01_01295 [Paraphaeosphaeria minitans]|uniref:Uncharacterized protein n=1 Tax=Paraphaeosphaeria minitans TaxID=565426 RepID=A0A9P6GTV2_9PLEO|nr:hypothetical protein PMIN01_01295 [Paraphaeosphaeria minitans]
MNLIHAAAAARMGGGRHVVFLLESYGANVVVLLLCCADDAMCTLTRSGTPAWTGLCLCLCRSPFAVYHSPFNIHRSPVWQLHLQLQLQRTAYVTGSLAQTPRPFVAAVAKPDWLAGKAGPLPLSLPFPCRCRAADLTAWVGWIYLQLRARDTAAAGVWG